jgi:hypothetical protein
MEFWVFFLGIRNLELWRRTKLSTIKLEIDFMEAYGFIPIHDFQLPIVKAMQELLCY